MEGHQALPGLVQKGMDGGYVTVAAEDLGVGQGNIWIEEGKHPLGAVAAPDTEDALDGII